VRKKYLATGWPHHLAEIWEELVRQSVAEMPIDGTRWHPAARWWGKTEDGDTCEIDVVAEGVDDPNKLLVGEVKLSCARQDVPRLLAEVLRKAQRCSWARGRTLTSHLWVLRSPGHALPTTATDARQLLASWRENLARQDAGMDLENPHVRC